MPCLQCRPSSRQARRTSSRSCCCRSTGCRQAACGAAAAAKAAAACALCRCRGCPRAAAGFRWQGQAPAATASAAAGAAEVTNWQCSCGRRRQRCSSPKTEEAAGCPTAGQGLSRTEKACARHSPALPEAPIAAATAGQQVWHATGQAAAAAPSSPARCRQARCTVAGTATAAGTGTAAAAAGAAAPAELGRACAGTAAAAAAGAAPAHDMRPCQAAIGLLCSSHAGPSCQEACWVQSGSSAGRHQPGGAPAVAGLAGGLAGGLARRSRANAV